MKAMNLAIKGLKSTRNSGPHQFAAWFFVLALTVIALVARLPAIQREKHPFLFCDEWMFYGDAFGMYQSGHFITSEFRSGAVNSIPVALLARLAQPFLGELSLDSFLILGRVSLTVTLSSLATVFIYMAAKRMTSSTSLALLAASIYVFSPFAIAMSRYWYPDHYIVFFSSVFLWSVAGVKFSDVSRGRLFLIAVVAAATLSVKLTFAPVLAAWVFVTILQLTWRDPNWRATLRTTLGNSLKLSFLVGVFFLAINYSIFAAPDKFLWALSYNAGNYGSSPPSLDGVLFYFLLVLLFVSPVLSVFAVIGLVIDKSSISLVLGVPVLFSSIIMGFQGLIVNRNIAVLIPFIVILTASGVMALYRKSRDLKSRVGSLSLSLGLGLALVLNLVLVSLAWMENMREDSRSVALVTIQEFGIPKDAVVGVNWSCSGPPVAAVAGFNVAEDTNMEQGLDYYVFDSAYASAISGWYWDEQNVYYLWNQRFMHFYNFNDRNLGSNILTFISGSLSPKEMEVPGYEVLKEIKGEGPAVVILKKDN
jgi:hypothetical protein